MADELTNPLWIKELEKQKQQKEKDLAVIPETEHEDIVDQEDVIEEVEEEEEDGIIVSGDDVSFSLTSSKKKSGMDCGCGEVIAIPQFKVGDEIFSDYFGPGIIVGEKDGFYKINFETAKTIMDIDKDQVGTLYGNTVE